MARTAMLVLAASAVSHAGLGAAQKEGLDVPIDSFSEAGQPMYDAMRHLAEKADLPMGFEGRSEYPKTQITVQVTAGTVRSALTKLVEADPRYSWVVSKEGLVNIGPKELNAREDLLGTVVSAFTIKDLDSTQAVDELLATREISAKLMALGVKERRLIAGNQTSGWAGPKVSLSAHNSSMRSIMNELARASGSLMWVATRYGDRSQYITVFLSGRHTY